MLENSYRWIAEVALEWLPVPWSTPAMIDDIHVEALKFCRENLSTVMGGLRFLTVSAPRNVEWDAVRDKGSSLDSIADVMRQALDALPGSPTSSGR